MFINEKQTKSVLAKYTRQTDSGSLGSNLPIRPRYLRQRSHGDRGFDPTHRPTAAEWNQIDAKLASSTPTDGILRQQLRRRAEALGLVGGTMEVRIEPEFSQARPYGNLTALVLFVIPTIDESSSLNGGDYGKFSSY